MTKASALVQHFQHTLALAGVPSSLTRAREKAEERRPQKTKSPAPGLPAPSRVAPSPLLHSPRPPNLRKTAAFNAVLSDMETRIRDWGNLPDLPLSEVLRRLLPCLRSLYAFAATCRPWRRLLRASTADILRPGLPPLLLTSTPPPELVPLYPLVLARPLPYREFPTDATTFLSASRGYLLFRRRHLLVLPDALTGAERCALPLPCPSFPYHYAAVSPSHILVFHSQHAFFARPFPGPDPNAWSNWTKHRLPRAASFVKMVLEFRFRGRVLALTDRAQLLKFHLGASPQNQTVQMLPATGLPAATMFERWHFGPSLVAAGDRLLLVLFLLRPRSSSLIQQRRVHKVAVVGLDMVHMRWEEVHNIGAYSLFVDCKLMWEAVVWRRTKSTLLLPGAVHGRL